jgi:hypothetical protein
MPGNDASRWQLDRLAPERLPYGFVRALSRFMKRILGEQALFESDDAPDLDREVSLRRGEPRVLDQNGIDFSQSSPSQRLPYDRFCTLLSTPLDNKTPIVVSVL